MPRFSIIITSCNQKALIKDAVDSALAQGHPDREIIVIEDGSSDGSREVLQSYQDAIQFKALEKNAGACAARNWGASLAKGDFLVFLDGDDVLLPWALSVFDRILQRKQPKLILCSMIFFEDSLSSVNLAGRPGDIKVVEYAAYMKKDRTFRTSASAMVIDRQCFNDVGGWTVGVWPMEDADLLLKLGYAGRTVQILSPSTTAYRLHEFNFSRQGHKLVEGAHALIRREKSGAYPGGSSCRFERYAIIGGVAFWWLKMAFKMKLYAKGF